jgi:hypothetical protein
MVVFIAAIIGLGLLFVIQYPTSMNPIVIINIFMQTLPTSIAEVAICWTP